MSTQDARVYDVGYRSYEGPRRAPRWAVVVLARHTVDRVLGRRRGFRSKILPGGALLIAFAPAIGALAFAILAGDDAGGDELLSYGDYYGFIGIALILFASFVAPEALSTDRRTGMLGLYLAGPLDRPRYLVAKAAAVVGVMALMTVGPQLFLIAGRSVEGSGPSLGELPELLARVAVVGVAAALLYASVSMAVSSMTTRSAVAGVSVVLLLLVLPIASAIATDDGGFPDAAALVALPILPDELARRVLGSSEETDGAMSRLSTAAVVAAIAAWIAAGAAVCWLRYRRIEARR